MKQISSFIFSVLVLSILYSQSSNVTGRIIDAESGEAISGVNVISGEIGTSSDDDGYFVLNIPIGSNLTIQHIGYKTVNVTADEEMIIKLSVAVVRGEEIFVLANRAIPGVTPAAFSTLSSDEIEVHYDFQDVPMVLATEPGVFAYSESGNGTGYSYVSIRGFDQSRIAVMLDNVPLNDNESHQVYWVDHGDILSDAFDVQIQRGIGNSLYGAAAFGGSINVISGMLTRKEKFSLALGSGSYNTKKYSIKYQSGNKLGNKFNFSARLSQIESDGYREYHHSLQKALSLGLKYNGKKITHMFRGLLGYENTELLWDGVYGDDINNRKLRRKGYKGFTDNFFQQVYSLNSRLKFNNGSYFHNTAYLVMGGGYYEAEKTGKSFYDYNLDTITDSTYADSTTDLLRRKWIVNDYFGIVPQWTLKWSRLRLDLGGEIRFYKGDHFGKVSQFSAPELVNVDEFKYYNYIGTKKSLTVFAHVVYDLTERLLLTTDIQLLNHLWKMDQKSIGHAPGHQISANWIFINPRLGFTYHFKDNISIFGSYGKAEKEPADDQIINADEWSFSPQGAYPELIYDSELGIYFSSTTHNLSINVYQIDLANEVLQEVSFEEEGYYEYNQISGTTHEGVELDVYWHINNRLQMGVNGVISRNYYTSDELKGKLLPNRPGILANATMEFSLFKDLQLRTRVQYVGKRYIDSLNTNDNAINNYTLLDLGISYQWKSLKLRVKVNNLLDTLYVTHGEDWGWGWVAYWPGATRNYFFSLVYEL
ncbi:MAG: TonB-dependent receptor [Fidelibacterota bacterium]